MNSSQTITDSYKRDSFRSVATDDGTRFWLSGASSTASTAGVRYLANGTDTTTTALSASGGNTRQVLVVNGGLFVGSAAGTPGVSVFEVGSGLPTSGNQTFTSTIPAGTANYQSFFFADLNPGFDWNGTGFDTLYTSDTSGGKLAKWTYDGSAWNASGTVSISSIDCITGTVSGTNVTLYGTTRTTTGGIVFSFADNSGYNVTLSGSPTTIVTSAGTNFAFRGIAFAPTPVAHTPSVTDATTNEDVQSSGGLMISRNNADGSEVTHFKITNIQHGKLYQHDGTTEITANSFITYTQGNDGLKFTPTADYFGNASFAVQASLSSSGFRSRRIGGYRNHHQSPVLPTRLR